MVDVGRSSQIAVTMDLYTHVLPAVQQQAAMEMDRALKAVGVSDGVNRGLGASADRSS